VNFAFATILHAADRLGWQPAPTRQQRQGVYRWAVENGFAGIEWSPRWLDYHELGNTQIDELAAEVCAAGSRVVSVNLNRFLLVGHARAGEYVQRFARSIEFAARMNCQSVGISLSHPKSPSAARPKLTGADFSRRELDQSRDLLRVHADLAADLGIDLSVELHDDGMLDTADRLLSMLDAIDRPNVGCNPDLGNLIRTDPHADWRSALDALAPRMNYWHVKNYTQSEPRELDAGQIDYQEAFAIVQQTGYTGWVSLETYFGTDLLALQRRGLAYCRSLIE